MPPIKKQLAGRLALTLTALSLAAGTGCQSTAFPKLGGIFTKQKINFAEMVQAAPSVEQQIRSAGISADEQLAQLAGQPVSRKPLAQVSDDSVFAPASASSSASGPVAARATSPTARFDHSSSESLTATPFGNSVVRSQSPDDQTGRASQADGSTAQPGGVGQTAGQFPEFESRDTPYHFGGGSVGQGSGQSSGLNGRLGQGAGQGELPFPTNYADLDVYVAETQTGTVNFGGAYNSDNGIVGQFVINERNFDIARYPRSFREILDGTAWRGAGQTFRLELVPGAQLERYLVSFTEPFLFGSDYSFSASGYLFDRRYFDWDERRLGGRFSIGRRLTPDLSVNAGVRMESVTIDNPRVATSNELNNSLGTSNLFLGNVGLIRDTRDSQVLATEGSYLALTYTQAFGDYDFARGDIDYRRYKLLYERPDGSGRHTLSFGTKAGFSGNSTPIFENYFAGGFSTLRGFDFRGAAPSENGVRVGGEFQWLNSVEYMFPITADEMIRGVVFCDFGTVEESIELNSDNFRVAPGFGFRINMPGGGMGAPLAFDFAFPVLSAENDEEKIFSFYLGVLR